MQAIRTNTIANVTTLRRSIQALSLEMVAFKSDPLRPPLWRDLVLLSIQEYESAGHVPPLLRIVGFGTFADSAFASAAGRSSGSSTRAPSMPNAFAKRTKSGLYGSPSGVRNSVP